MEFRSRILPNGLEVIAEVDPQAFSCSMGYFVTAGSRDETLEESGVSHYLEHMVFKGSEKFGADEVNRAFDDFGADYNAATSEEQTVYYSSQLPEYLPRALELWTRLMRPALREDDFTTEKQVILEEIQMYADSPPYGADDWSKALYFGEHPLAKSVLGTPESVTALSSTQMRDYFLRRYSPQNLVLAAAGKVDFEDLCARTEKLTADWKGEAGPRPEAGAILPGGGFHVKTQAQSTQQYVLQTAPAPFETPELRRASRLAARILGDGSSSRLYWELVDSGLAESASLYYHNYIDGAAFHVFLTCSPEDLTENLQKLQAILREAEANGVTAEELHRARSKVCSSMVLGSERPRSRLFAVANRWIRHREYIPIAEQIQQLESVTVEDINQVLRDHPPSRCLTVTIGPLTEEEALAARPTEA